MRRIAILSFALVLFPGFGWAHELPPATPHDADREISQLDVKLYQVDLEVGEEFSLSAEFVKHVTVDEARLVVVEATDDDRLSFKGAAVGKAVIRIIWSYEPVAPKDEHVASHGMRMAITTIIVNVRGPRSKA